MPSKRARLKAEFEAVSRAFRRAENFCRTFNTRFLFWQECSPRCRRNRRCCGEAAGCYRNRSPELEARWGEACVEALRDGATTEQANAKGLAAVARHAGISFGQARRCLAARMG
jgi:hypothetical protein